jgi:hypothetical protein
VELAKVNNYDQAKLFFDEYNIPYEVISRGENKGKLRVKSVRRVDLFNLFEAEKRLRNANLDHLIDHKNYFRDADDNTVCTFSPYSADRVPEGVSWITVSDYSIYGVCTKTFVVVIPA